MIKCFVALCVVGHATVCQPPVEIMPDDGSVISSPMQCGKGGLTYFTIGGLAKDPNGTEWFPKVYGKQEGDDSGVIQAWLDEQKARRKRLAPQIK